MTVDWDEIGYIISSRYRVIVLQQLAEGPSTPTQLAAETGQNLSNVSRALQHLRSRDLVELLVPESRKKGRVYSITDKGTHLWDRLEAENLV